MKNKAILMFVVCTAIFSCKKENATPKPEEETSLATTTQQTNSKISLPDLLLDIEKFGEKEIQNGKELTALEIKNLGLEKMDAAVFSRISEYPGIKYFFLNNVYSGKNGSVKLLSRTYEMENQAWLATYDASNQLVDFKLVFYDEFAESAHQIETKIKNSEISITDLRLNFDTDEQEARTDSSTIDENLKFKNITTEN